MGQMILFFVVFVVIGCILIYSFWPRRREKMHSSRNYAHALDGRSGVGHCTFELPHTIDDTMNCILCFSKYSYWNDQIKQATIYETKSFQGICQYKVRFEFTLGPFLTTTLHMVHKRYNNRLVWYMDPNYSSWLFESNRGSWSLEKIDETCTLCTYDCTIVSKFTVPTAMQNWILKNAVFCATEWLKNALNTEIPPKKTRILSKLMCCLPDANRKHYLIF